MWPNLRNFKLSFPNSYDTEKCKTETSSNWANSNFKNFKLSIKAFESEQKNIIQKF